MPDLWEDFPEEMMGDRPPISMLTKQVKKPKEVLAKESGRTDGESFSKVYGSPKVK
jgi:hypothetical protein